MDDTLNTFRDALKHSGHRLTAARNQILVALARCGGHVSADDLVAIVHRDAPNVGRMTVYRTLDLLHDLGLIRPIYQGSAAAHYILMDKGHHHHLICSQCDRVFEFDDCVIPEIEQAIRDRFDFQVEGHLLEFYGLCPDCHSQ